MGSSPAGWPGSSSAITDAVAGRWCGGCGGSLCWLQFSQGNRKQEGREGRWKEVVEVPSFIIINLFGGKEERGLGAPKTKQQLSQLWPALKFTGSSLLLILS